MDKYQCTKCEWEGTEDELKVQMNPNPVNPQDKTLYEEDGCPECGCTFLVNLTEEDYINNWARTVNPNDL